MMKKIVCHGDSLTEGSDLEKSYTWPRLLQNQLGVEVRNSGIGGDTTGGLLSRFYFDVLKHRPGFVFIMGGTNDLWWDLDIRIIQANIFAMACQAQYHDIAPIIGVPLPLHMERVLSVDMLEPVGGYERCSKKLSQLASELIVSAEKSEIPILDFYHLFMGKGGDVLGDYFLEDGLHPNKQGHRLIAEKTAELMRSVFSFCDPEKRK